MGEPTKEKLQETLIREVAQFIAFDQNAQKYFDEVYYTNKYRFYSAAKNTTVFSTKATISHKLEFEAAIKRNLGILLVAEDDIEIYNRIKPIMLKQANYSIRSLPTAVKSVPMHAHYRKYLSDLL